MPHTTATTQCRPPALAACLGALLALGQARAQALPDDALQQRRQEEQIRAQRQRLETGIDARSAPTASDTERLPDRESPCMVIQQIELQGQDAGRFAWVLDALAGAQQDDSPLRTCLGARGLGVVQQRAQAALLARSFVTSRVLVQPQNLRAGLLVL